MSVGYVDSSIENSFELGPWGVAEAAEAAMLPRLAGVDSGAGFTSTVGCFIVSTKPFSTNDFSLAAPPPAAAPACPWPGPACGSFFSRLMLV